MKTLDSDQALALTGLSLLAVGLALVAVPLSLSVVGLLLIGYSIAPDHGEKKP